MFVLQAENISTVTKAAGVTVEPYWPGLFAKLFEKKSIADLITNVGAGNPTPSLPCLIMPGLQSSGSHVWVLPYQARD